MHCRPLHIHVPSQRRACPDAKEKHGEASQRGIHPKNKKLQPLPLLECQKVCLFCCVLFFNHSLNRWATVTHLVRKSQKSSLNGMVKLQQPLVQTKSHFSKIRPCSWGNSFLSFIFKWCHGQAQACTVSVAPAVHILSINLINSSGSASRVGLCCLLTVMAHSFHFCFSENILIFRVI